MKAYAGLIQKDRELSAEYEQILADFNLKKISDSEYHRKLSDLHIRLLIHLDEVKKYKDSDPDLTKISVLTQRSESIKQQVKEIADKYYPRTEEQKTTEEMIGQIIENHTSEVVTDVFAEKNNGKRRFGIKLNNGNSMFIEFDSQFTPLNFSKSAFEILKKIISKNKPILIKWANDYNQNERDYHFFIYDLPALAKFVSELPAQFDKLTKLSGDYDNLVHNRVIAQLAVQYQNLGCKIDIEITNSKGMRPDLHVDNSDLEVKTIISPGFNHQDHFVKFSKSLRNRLGEAVGQIDTQNDMVAIAPWSQIMNNTLKTYYNGLLVTKLSSFEKGKAVLILEGEKPFEDYYYLVPLDQIENDIRKFAEKGYQKISPYSYLGSTTRRGYAITRSGPPRAGSGFTFRIN